MFLSIIISRKSSSNIVYRFDKYSLQYDKTSILFIEVELKKFVKYKYDTPEKNAAQLIVFNIHIYTYVFRDSMNIFTYIHDHYNLRARYDAK